MKNFTNLDMQKIINILKDDLADIKHQEIIEFEVLNPDNITSVYSGEPTPIDNVHYVYYGYKSWVDLAQILKCKMLTPRVISKNTVAISFKKLDSDVSFHKSTEDKEKKYGKGSIFSKIYKNQEPSFIYYYTQSLKNVNIDEKIRILNLGINNGDEFEAIINYSQNFHNLELIGIDYCESAIQEAKEKFKNYSNINFYTHNINELNSLDLGEFDLIISIGTLQSSNLEFNPLLMSIVQNYLKRDGAMILGFPNCRWIDGEMIYGARVKNYPFSEMGLLYKDVIFAKKYLQQKKFRVTITGKDYIFLTATSIRKD